MPSRSRAPAQRSRGPKPKLANVRDARQTTVFVVEREDLRVTATVGDPDKPATGTSGAADALQFDPKIARMEASGRRP